MRQALSHSRDLRVVTRSRASLRFTAIHKSDRKPSSLSTNRRKLTKLNGEMVLFVGVFLSFEILLVGMFYYRRDAKVKSRSLELNNLGSDGNLNFSRISDLL